jgi:tRNA(Arg) A34 adenosine deaminase TadA
LIPDVQKKNKVSMDGTLKFIDLAFDDAFESVKNNLGGPFGAVIVKDGKIIGRGVNQVISQNDPTAHAEVMAIRDACNNIGHFDLTGAILYSTCEPCPMCLSAIYWANIQKVYYCSTRKDAEAIGFRDKHIYEELNLPMEKRRIRFLKIDNPKGDSLFRSWMDKSDKTLY